MSTGILQHRRLRPNTEQDVPQKPSNKPEPKEKHTEKKHGSCEKKSDICLRRDCTVARKVQIRREIYKRLQTRNSALVYSHRPPPHAPLLRDPR